MGIRPAPAGNARGEHGRRSGARPIAPRERPAPCSGWPGDRGRAGRHDDRPFGERRARTPSAFGTDWDLEVNEEPEDPEAMMRGHAGRTDRRDVVPVRRRRHRFQGHRPDRERSGTAVRLRRPTRIDRPVRRRRATSTGRRRGGDRRTVRRQIGAEVGDDITLEPTGETFRVAGIGRANDGDDTDVFVVTTMGGLERLGGAGGAPQLTAALVRVGDAGDSTMQRLDDLGWEPTTPPSKVGNLGQIGSVPRLLAGARSPRSDWQGSPTRCSSPSHVVAATSPWRAPSGSRPRQARATIIWQGLVIAGAAIVVGVPVGVLIGRVVWKRVADGVGALDLVSIPWLRVRRHSRDRAGGGDGGGSDHRVQGGAAPAGGGAAERMMHAAWIWASREMRRGWLSLLVVALLVADHGRHRDGRRRRGTAGRCGGRPIPDRRRVVGCHDLHPDPARPAIRAELDADPRVRAVQDLAIVLVTPSDLEPGLDGATVGGARHVLGRPDPATARRRSVSGRGRRDRRHRAAGDRAWLRGRRGDRSAHAHARPGVGMRRRRRLHDDERRACDDHRGAPDVGGPRARTVQRRPVRRSPGVPRCSGRRRRPLGDHDRRVPHRPQRCRRGRPRLFGQGRQRRCRGRRIRRCRRCHRTPPICNATRC